VGAFVASHTDRLFHVVELPRVVPGPNRATWPENAREYCGGVARHVCAYRNVDRSLGIQKLARITPEKSACGRTTSAFVFDSGTAVV